MAENGAYINIQGNGEANSSLTIKGINNDNPQIGIGSGRDLKCGDITINDIALDIATDYGSGIGTSINSMCGNINLANCKLNITTTSNAVCIGASTGNNSFSSQCGNIVLRNCDMTGNAGNWSGAFPAAIGSSAVNAICGNIDIYLRENETVNDFIARLTVPGGVDKVGKGNKYMSYGEPSHGEITWYNHEGKQIDSGAKK